MSVADLAVTPSHRSLEPAVRDCTEDALRALSDGRYEDVIGSIEALQRHAPDDPLALYLVGLLSLRLEEPGKALTNLEAAYHLAPSIREYAESLSIIYAKIGRVTESLFYAKIALAATESLGIVGLVPAWLGSFEQSFFRMADRPIQQRAEAAVQSCDWRLAAELYRKWIETEPDDLTAHAGLARTLVALEKGSAALVALRAIAAWREPDTEDLACYSAALALTGNWDEARTAARMAADQAPDDCSLNWTAIVLAMMDPSAHATDIVAAAENWSGRFKPAEPSIARHVRPDIAHRRLRLGIFAGRWREDDGLDLLVPLFAALPPGSVEIFAYADGHVGTPLAKRLQSVAAHWEEIGELDDDTIGFMLANDDLDVLIDLDGPLARSRHGLFLSHPAPMLLTIGDLVETAQAAGFDGVIGDAMIYSAETAVAPLVLLPSLLTLSTDLLLLERNEDQPAPGGDRLRIGSLARWHEITPLTIELWSAILQLVPESVLSLSAERLGGDYEIDKLLGGFRPHIDETRIEIIPEGTPLADFVGKLDLLLEAPMSHHPQEAVVALANGIPTVTLAGELPQQRLLAGFLHRLGLDDLVASNAGSYVSKAVAALRDATLPARLSALMEAERQVSATRNAAVLETGLRAFLASVAGGAA